VRVIFQQLSVHPAGNGYSTLVRTRKVVGDEDEEEERQPTSITRWLYEWALKYPRQTRPLAKGQPLRLLDDLCIEKDKVNEICD